MHTASPNNNPHSLGMALMIKTHEHRHGEDSLGRRWHLLVGTLYKQLYTGSRLSSGISPAQENHSSGRSLGYVPSEIKCG